MDFLLYVVAFCILVWTLQFLLDLLAHISRYREEIRKYPATKSIRGKVWWFTRDNRYR